MRHHQSTVPTSIRARALQLVSLAATLGCLLLAVPAAWADVPLEATICNKTQQPVLFEFFHHNDAFTAVPFATAEVHPCACKNKRMNTDMWKNFPRATVRQLAFREVSAENNYRVAACIKRSGEFSGYIKMVKGTAKSEDEVCAEAERSEYFHSAPEITRAQGDLPILETRMDYAGWSCLSSTKDLFGNTTCTKYSGTYDYDNGTHCYGNE
jgi:hypothetical protein